MTKSLTQKPRQPIDQWWQQFRTGRKRCDQSHVEVYLPACAPAPGTHAHRNCFFDRLAEATGNHVDSYDTTIVGKKICLCDRCRQHEHHRQLLDTVTELRSWEGGGLQATSFIERDVRSSLTGEHHRVISVPELAVGIYLDDSLVGVFPCQSREAHYSPEMFLQRLTNSSAEPGSGQDHGVIHSDSV